MQTKLPACCAWRSKGCSDRINGESLRTGVFLHGSDRNFAGSATCNKHVERAGFAKRRECAGGELIAQILIDRDLRDLFGDMHPARVGISSYCCCTRCETSSSIGVRRGIELRAPRARGPAPAVSKGRRSPVPSDDRATLARARAHTKAGTLPISQVASARSRRLTCRRPRPRD